MATLLAVLAADLPALEINDPFATNALTPPRPVLTGTQLPC